MHLIQTLSVSQLCLQCSSHFCFCSSVNMPQGMLFDSDSCFSQVDYKCEVIVSVLTAGVSSLEV